MSSRSPRSDSRGRSRTPARMPSAPRDDEMRSVSRSRSRSRAARSDHTGGAPGRSNGRRTRTRSPSPTTRSAKIVVEKLTKNISAAHLREIFGGYGALADLEMPMNRQFMTNRGIAYLLYAHAADAERAIAHMHEAQLDGAQISVSIVLPRRRFSRSPPPRRPPPNRFGEPHRLREPYAGGGGRGGGPPSGDRGFARSGPPPYRGPGRPRSPPPRYGGRGGGYRDRYDEPRGGYRPRSYSRSRSPPPRRRPDASRSRSPPRRRNYSPPRGVAGPPGAVGADEGRRRRSPSYSSYGSRGYSRDRSPSRDRGRGGR